MRNGRGGGGREEGKSGNTEGRGIGRSSLCASRIWGKGNFVFVFGGARGRQLWGGGRAVSLRYGIRPLLACELNHEPARFNQSGRMGALKKRESKAGGPRHGSGPRAARRYVFVLWREMEGPRRRVWGLVRKVGLHYATGKSAHRTGKESGAGSGGDPAMIPRVEGSIEARRGAFLG